MTRGARVDKASRARPALERADYQSVRATLAVSVDRLARVGADFFACPDNTAHIALEQPGASLALPGLHIAEVVADQAAVTAISGSACSARNTPWRARSTPGPSPPGA